jgi:hypothetical protein
MGNTMSLSLGIDATYQSTISDAGSNLTQADPHNLINAAAWRNERRLTKPQNIT